MSIKQHGGIFGRNPTFNNVGVKGTLTVDGAFVVNGSSMAPIYKGTWNANTNTPTLTSSVGVQGNFYIVSVAGTTTLDGISTWNVGDWALYNGVSWQKVEGGTSGNFATLTVTGASEFGDGAAITPSITNIGDVDTGIYFPADNTLGITTAGTERVRVDSSGGVTLSSGTANGVAYLNGSKVLTTGTALTFDGTNVGIGTTSPGALLETRKDTNATVNELIRLRNDGTGNGGGVSINFTQGTTSTGYVRNWYSGSWRTDIGSYQNITFSVGVSPAEVVRIDSSGNFGIGTSSPDAKLRVNGTVKVGEGVASNTSKLMVNTVSGVAAGIQLFQDANESWIIQNPASTTALTFGNSGTERMRITAAGDVGIGTSSPGVRLDVVGGSIRTTSWVDITPSTATNNALYRSTNTGGTLYSGLDNSAGGVTGAAYAGMMWHTGAYPLVFATNGVEGMRLTSTGLGIGTTSPAVPLEVIGQTTVDGAATGAATGTLLIKGAKTDSQGFKFTFNNSTNLADITNFYSGALTFGTNNTERMRIDSSGNLGIGTTSPSTIGVSGYTRLVLGAGGSSTDGLTIVPSNIGGIQFTDAAAVKKGYMQWDSATGAISLGTAGTTKAILDSSGNLGLGVTPSAWSGVSSAFELKGNAYLYSTTGVMSVGANAYFNGTNWIYKTTQAASRYEQVNGQHQWGIAASGTAGTAITFTQAMTLDANGRLMVGTTSPISTYDKTITVVGSGSAGLTMGDGTRQWAFGVNGGALQFYDNTAAAERMRIDSSGNVGIGTTTPSSYAKLTVWGGNVWAQSVTAGVGARITLSDTNNLSWIDSAPSGGASNMAFAVNNSEQMRLTSTGLGIGTNSPASKLHVSGSGDIFRFTNGSVTLFGYSDSQGLGWFTGAGGTGVGVYYNHSNNYQGFYTASAEKMRLDSSGNLGLGVTPSAWISSYRALNIGDSGLLSSRTGASINNVELGVNWFRNSAGSFVYKANGYGTNYQQFDGAHYWYTAPSGTAGNAITFTQAMTLDASGNLIVGATSGTEAFNVKRGAGLSAYAEFAGNNNTLGTASVLYGQDSGSNGYYWNRANAPLLFGTNNTERLRITSAGNIHTPAGATTMTNGFFYIPAAAGVPSGVPTAITGTVPMYYDTTNNKFYVYNGAWKSVALL